jgi:hypothetical protein
MNTFVCMDCNCLTNPCDHPPCFLWTHLCRHCWILTPTKLYTQGRSSRPREDMTSRQWKWIVVQKSMARKQVLRPEVSVVLVTTVNNCQVFDILKQAKLHPEAPCDHMVITTCWSSHVFASDHVSVLTYRVVNLPLQWSNLEFVCFDDAFYLQKEEGTVSWTNHC